VIHPVVDVVDETRYYRSTWPLVVLASYMFTKTRQSRTIRTPRDSWRPTWKCGRGA